MTEAVQKEKEKQAEKPRNPGWANIKPAKPGEVRNPRGRPLGARTKLAESYLQDLYDAWQTDGPRAIAETVKRKPWEFVKIVSALMPQKIEVTNRFASMDDNELTNSLLRAIKDITPGANGGTAPRLAGREARTIEAEAQQVSAIPEANGLPRRREGSS